MTNKSKKRGADNEIYLTKDDGICSLTELTPHHRRKSCHLNPRIASVSVPSLNVLGGQAQCITSTVTTEANGGNGTNGVKRRVSDNTVNLIYDATTATDNQSQALLLFEQKQKYERMLSDALAAVESSRLLNDELAKKLIEQTKISNSFELCAVNAQKEMKEIRSIAANTAHDLKSPLNTLMLGTYNYSVHMLVLSNA